MLYIEWKNSSIDQQCHDLIYMLYIMRKGIPYTRKENCALQSLQLTMVTVVAFKQLPRDFSPYHTLPSIVHSEGQSGTARKLQFNTENTHCLPKISRTCRSIRDIYPRRSSLNVCVYCISVVPRSSIKKTTLAFHTS